MAELKYYIIRRLATFIPTILGILLLVFIISHAIPANPARLWAGGEKAKPEVVEAIKKKYHLDKPYHIQFMLYLNDLIHGDWGQSPMTKRPVLEDLADYFPATFELALVSGILIMLIGIPLGLVSAFKRNTWIDHVVRILALVGVSMPVFWLAIILQWIFYYELDVFPATGRGISPSHVYTGLYLLDSILSLDWKAFIVNLQHIILPALTLAFAGIGVIARITRNSVLEVLSSDYIDFAEAKGLVGLQFYRHVVKNASIPVITVLGLQFGMLMAGAVITETIFAWPGIGSYTVNAISSLDYPAIMGSTLLIGLVFITVNLLVDIFYAIVDPRIRF
ncbi:MAG: ABC transporter permease [Desulfurococcales archaeon]|nr:ABC transporter permease [Desulfurococcales archaeon]